MLASAVQRELMAQHTFPLLNCAGTLWKLLKTRNGMVLNSKTAVLASDAITYKIMALFKFREVTIQGRRYKCRANLQ